MLRQIIATLVFLFFSRFRQTLFFQREKRCDNRYSTNGGASTWRQRTWSRGNASTQCHSSGNYWTSGLILYCGCSSPGEFDISKTGAEVMNRFKCRGSGSLKLFVQPFCGIIGCRTREAFVNCYWSVSMKLWWEVVLCSVSVLLTWICFFTVGAQSRGAGYHRRGSGPTFVRSFKAPSERRCNVPLWVYHGLEKFQRKWSHPCVSSKRVKGFSQPWTSSNGLK